MGVEGFFGYLNRGNVEGGIIDHSIDEILQQIKIYRERNNKSPKILFDLRAFNNYYEQSLRDVIVGCRFNLIKKDFESLLSSLTLAGAELIFVSKRNLLDDTSEEEVRMDWFNDDYKQGMEFVKILKEGSSAEEVKALLGRHKNYPWQETTIHVLVQSAQKFGKFMERNGLENSTLSHIELLKDEEMFAICGLNTSYLFHPGPWKIFFPAKKNTRTRDKEMIFKEFNVENILRHFRFDVDQFQLFGVLGGKLDTKLEYQQMLKNHFKDGNYKNFQAIADFVHKFAPPEKFPLQRETFEEILHEIFGSADDQLVKDFKEGMSFDTVFKLSDSCSIIKDQKTKDLLQGSPFSLFAESIFHGLPIEILSPFLDVNATDMKPLKDLTVGWIERLAGILLRDIDESKSFSIYFRIPPGKLKKFNATPKFPLGLPDWNQLIADEVSIEEKFETLQFLIGDLISIEKLKTIPFEYMMHVIITMHLIKNNSMTMKEAIAMTKAVCDKNEANYIRYPKKTNARAFRISSLYEKMFSVLLMCLSPLGLNEFIAELKLDNVLFQVNLITGSREVPPRKDALKTIMGIIN